MEQRRADRSAPQAAHSGAVGAGAKMPVRQQRQVSDQGRDKAGYDCSTPIRVTLACWLLGTRSGHLIDANEHGC
jgi:hypothetical protein